MLMYVTAKYANTELTAKNQIWVKILKSGDKKSNASYPSIPKSALMPTFLSNKPPPYDLNRRRPPFTKVTNALNVPSQATTTSTAKSTSINDDHSKPDESVLSKNKDTASGFTKSSNVKSTKSPEPIPTQEAGQLAILLIPSVVILSGLFVAAILVYMFRKKICRKRHKMKKDDMVSILIFFHTLNTYFKPILFLILQLLHGL